ncbi:MAG: TolC family protein [Bacteroidota bacterium]
MQLLKLQNTTKTKLFALSALITLCNINGFSQTESIPPELKNLIVHAIDSSYTLKNKEIEVQQTLIQKTSVWETYLPKLSADGMYATGAADITLDIPKKTGMILQLPQSGEMTFNNKANFSLATLNASMPLFTGFKVPYSAKALEQKKAAQQFLIEKDKAEIVRDVIKTYDMLAVLKQSELVLDESAKRLEYEKHLSDKALENELIAPYEQKKIEIAILSLDAKRVELTGNKKLVIQKLSMLTHLPEDTISKLNVNITAWVIENTEGTIENRAELKALDAAFLANKFKMKSDQYYWLPKIQAMGTYGYANVGDLNIKTPFYHPLLKSNIELDVTKTEINPAWYVGVGFKWEIFDGFHGHHINQTAKLEMQKTLNSKYEAENLLNLNLQKSKVDLQVANQQLKIKQKQVEYEQSILQQSIKSYHEGLISINERITEETEFQKIQLDYIQAIYNQRLNAVNYLDATGLLTKQSF